MPTLQKTQNIASGILQSQITGRPIHHMHFCDLGNWGLNQPMAMPALTPYAVKVDDHGNLEWIRNSYESSAMQKIEQAIAQWNCAPVGEEGRENLLREVIAVLVNAQREGRTTLEQVGSAIGKMLRTKISQPSWQGLLPLQAIAHACSLHPHLAGMLYTEAVEATAAALRKVPMAESGVILKALGAALRQQRMTLEDVYPPSSDYPPSPPSANTRAWRDLLAKPLPQGWVQGPELHPRNVTVCREGLIDVVESALLSQEPSVPTSDYLEGRCPESRRLAQRVFFELGVGDVIFIPELTPLYARRNQYAELGQVEDSALRKVEGAIYAWNTDLLADKNRSYFLQEIDVAIRNEQLRGHATFEQMQSAIVQTLRTGITSGRFPLMPIVPLAHVLGTTPLDAHQLLVQAMNQTAIEVWQCAPEAAPWEVLDMLKVSIQSHVKNRLKKPVPTHTTRGISQSTLASQASMNPGTVTAPEFRGIPARAALSVLVRRRKEDYDKKNTAAIAHWAPDSVCAQLNQVPNCYLDFQNSFERINLMNDQLSQPAWPLAPGSAKMPCVPQPYVPAPVSAATGALPSSSAVDGSSASMPHIGLSVVTSSNVVSLPSHAAQLRGLDTASSLHGSNEDAVQQSSGSVGALRTILELMPQSVAAIHTSPRLPGTQAPSGPDASPANNPRVQSPQPMPLGRMQADSFSNLPPRPKLSALRGQANQQQNFGIG